MAKRSKTLGAYQETIQYHSERYYGMRNGYMKSFVNNAMWRAVHWDVGRDWNTSKTFREYVDLFYKGWREETLDQLRQHNATRNRKWRWKGDDTRNNLARQLIALRMFRQRVKEETAKGDELLREKGLIP